MYAKEMAPTVEVSSVIPALEGDKEYVTVFVSSPFVAV
jgi:hypothetical protein